MRQKLCVRRKSAGPVNGTARAKMSVMAKPELVSINEAAEILGVSRRCVRGMIKRKTPLLYVHSTIQRGKWSAHMLLKSAVEALAAQDRKAGRPAVNPD